MTELPHIVWQEGNCVILLKKWKVAMISRAEGKRVSRGPVFIMNYCNRQLYLKLCGDSSTMILGWEMLITTEQPPGLAEIPGQSGGTWVADAIFYRIPAVKNAIVSSFSYIGYRWSKNRFYFFQMESRVFTVITVAGWWSKVWVFSSLELRKFSCCLNTKCTTKVKVNSVIIILGPW